MCVKRVRARKCVRARETDRDREKPWREESKIRPEVGGTKMYNLHNTCEHILINRLRPTVFLVNRVACGHASDSCARTATQKARHIYRVYKSRPK